MGRKRNHYLREFYIEKDKECECKFCGHKISNYVTNLKRHLEQNHGEITKDLTKKAKINEPSPKETKNKFTVEMSKEELINACIDMIVKDCVPVSFFDSNSFKFLTNPYFNGLKIAPVNAANIMDLVVNKTEGIKNKIKAKLENEILNVKIVITNCQERAFLGINVPIISRNKVVMKCLALLELDKNPTAENIKIKIENVLRDYKINKKQLYSITYEIESSHFIKAEENIAEPQQLKQNENCLENVIQNMKFENLILFKCPAQILQLSVKDFLERTAAKFKKMDSSLDKSHLDIASNWTSTYNMLKKLLELIYVSLNNLSVTETEWSQIDNVREALESIQELFQNLQNSQLLLGDFYKHWMILIFKLKNINTDESRKLLAEIGTRLSVFLENDTMYAALYLDPRFRRTLTNTKKQLATTHLKKIYLQIQSLEKENMEMLESPTVKTEENIMDETAMQSSSSFVIRTMESSLDDSIIKTEETFIGDYTMQNSSALLTEQIDSLPIPTREDATDEYTMQSSNTHLRQDIENLNSLAIKTESDEYTMPSSSSLFRQNNDSSLLVPTIKTESAEHTMLSSSSVLRQTFESLDIPTTRQSEEITNNSCPKQNSLSLLQKYLQEMENSNASFDESDEFDDCNINFKTRKVFLEIENYKEKRIDVDQDLLEYWNSKKFMLPYLRKLAMIVHTVPVTQITNESSFSALEMFLGDLHHNFSDKQFDSIMYLKLNTDI